MGFQKNLIVAVLSTVAIIVLFTVGRSSPGGYEHLKSWTGGLPNGANPPLPIGDETIADNPAEPPPQPPPPPPPPPPPVDPNKYSCDPAVTENLRWLDNYDFAYPITYTSRDINASPGTGSRPTLTVIDELLFNHVEEFTREELSNDRVVDHCSSALTLEVPFAPPVKVDAGHMIFGLSTTMKRLKDTKKHLARWLTNTDARLVAIVVEKEGTPASIADMLHLETQFRDEGMDVVIRGPANDEDQFNQRYFSIVPFMYEHVTDRTQWTIVIDDDTFFPSMPALIKEFRSHDHTRPSYIGGLSENWGAVDMFGFMGFGGAGVFISTPLAKIIWENNAECKHHMRFSSGDTLLRDCIFIHSNAQFTPIKSLWQIDLEGDQSGFYETGREMLSVHHWKSNAVTQYPYEMEKMHLVADLCDGCFLQRFQFANDVVLTNGFSISKYPDGSLEGAMENDLSDWGFEPDKEKIDLRRAEITWNGKEMNVLHSLAPTRPEVEAGRKKRWAFLDSMLMEEGRVVRQLYVRRGEEEEDGKAREKDEILVLNWRDGGRLL